MAEEAEEASPDDRRAAAAGTAPLVASKRGRCVGVAREPRCAEEIGCGSIEREGRQVAYAVAGDPSGRPVLVFYPLGAGRRLVALFHSEATASGLRLICVNRPGKQGTSAARGRGAANHTSTTCADALAVLDALGITKVSLLFMCAGAPFALAMASRHTDRMTGRLVGIAPWVSPRDFPPTKLSYKLGKALPSKLVGPLVGTCVAAFNGGLRSMPVSMTVRGLSGKLSGPERQELNERCPDIREFANECLWVMGERGGVAADLEVLFAAGEDVGVNYAEVPGSIEILHGDADTMVPMEAAQWLESRLADCTLARLPGGTHQGALLMLHLRVLDSIRGLAGRVSAIS